MPLRIYQAFCRPAAFATSRLDDQATRSSQHASVPGVQHEQVQANGLEIHVARAGVSKSKQLVLFLHGWPECDLAAAIDAFTYQY